MKESPSNPPSITKPRLPLLMLVSAAVLRLSQPSYAATTATTDGLNSSNTIQPPLTLSEQSGSPVSPLVGSETSLESASSLYHTQQMSEPAPQPQLSEAGSQLPTQIDFAQGQTTIKVVGAAETDNQFSSEKGGVVGLELRDNSNTAYSLSATHTVTEYPTPRTGTLSFNFGGTFYAHSLDSDEIKTLPFIPDGTNEPTLVEATFRFTGSVYHNDTLVWTNVDQFLAQQYNIETGRGDDRQYIDWSGLIDNLTLKSGDKLRVELSTHNLIDSNAILILGGSDKDDNGDRKSPLLTFQESVPEPSTSLLSAGAILAFFRRKR